MIKRLINNIKAYVFGEVTHGEKIKFPKIRSVYPEGYVQQDKVTIENIEAFNKWSRSINFGGMHVKQQF